MFDSDVVRQALGRGRVSGHVRATVLVLALLGGCGPAKTPDQLVVKGDGFEVTLQEYDQLLRQAPPVTKDAVAPLRRALLQQLIQEKLFAQAATKAKMNEDFETLQTIEAAKRDILAQAYVRNLTGSQPKPNPRDVQTYYDAHPILFANRRRFVIDEYVLQSDLPDIRGYLDVLSRSGFPALGAALTDKVPGLTPVAAVRFTDELPDVQNGVLEQLTTGSTIVYQSPGQIHLGVVRSMTVEPLAIDAARARIEQKLVADRAAAIVTAAASGLRASRHVEILNANLKEIASGGAKEATKP